MQASALNKILFDLTCTPLFIVQYVKYDLYTEIMTENRVSGSLTHSILHVP